MQHPATQDVTIITRAVAGRDDDGNVTRSTATRTVPGLYAPSGSSENTNDQQQVISQEQVIIRDAPADLVVNPTDQVQVASLPDVTFEVDGRVQPWHSGIVIPLRRVTG
jgi:hypothetical protein